MKSKASIKSHPIHPILITFPIAFFMGAFIFDVIALTADSQEFLFTSKVLSTAGIATALLAAVPGIIDYLYTVPPKSSAKKRATKHGLTNITVVLLFGVALWLKTDQLRIPMGAIFLEVAGVILLGIAGWLGGTLVYRNQIGVDPRYAHAGKWQEETFNESTGPLEIGSVDDLKVNQLKLLKVGKKRFVLCRSESGFHIIDDRCTHRGGSLAGGSMICGTVQCPWHGSQFSVKDGTASAGPATEKIPVYPLQERDKKLYLEL